MPTINIYLSSKKFEKLLRILETERKKGKDIKLAQWCKKVVEDTINGD